MIYVLKIAGVIALASTSANFFEESPSNFEILAFISANWVFNSACCDFKSAKLSVLPPPHDAMKIDEEMIGIKMF